MSWDIAMDDAHGAMALSGELTIFSVQEIHQRLIEALAKHDELTVDLRDIVEVDTAGLQLMLLAKRKPGKAVRFCHHPEVVLRLIDLANLGQTLGDPLVLQAT